MVKVLFGNKYVGVQGIYYFNNEAYAKKFSSCVQKVLYSVRNGTDEWKMIVDEWFHDMALCNFLLAMANKAMLEKEDTSIWYDDGNEHDKFDEVYNGEAWIKLNKEDEKIDIVE